MSGPGDPHNTSDVTEHEIERERHELLERVSRGLQLPMVVLGFVWLVLLIVEVTAGLSPFLSRTVLFIWGLFIVHFLLELTIAPRKRAYLKRHWLTAIALVVPAVRVFAVARVLRVAALARGAGSLRFVQVLGSINRGMRALGRVMVRRGVGYVAMLTLVVLLGGAAGMYAFEGPQDVPHFANFGSALWWTAMTITTMGTDYFPLSPEGRLLCLLLAVYGYAVFGYVTASIASFFVSRDAEESEGELPSKRQLEELREEIRQLRADLVARG